MSPEWVAGAVGSATRFRMHIRCGQAPPCPHLRSSAVLAPLSPTQQRWRAVSRNQCLPPRPAVPAAHLPNGPSLVLSSWPGGGGVKTHPPPHPAVF